MTPRRLFATQALLAAVVGLVMLLAAPQPLRQFWLDVQLRLAAPAQSAEGVLLIDIDEAGLQQLRADFGPWPLPRDSYALAADALRDAGARAVVINLQLSDEREGDAALARVIERPGAPVLLAASGLPSLGETQPDAAWRWAQIKRPSASLRVPANAIGLISSPLDADGHLRDIVLQHRDAQSAGSASLPWLSLALLQRTGQTQQLAADERGRVTPLFSAASPPRHSLAALLRAARDPREPQQVLQAARDKVVFIGAVAPLGDGVMTAVGQLDGNNLLAQSYLALRDGLGLRALDSAGALMLLGLALLPALLALLRGRSSLGLALGGGAAIALALAALLVLLPLFGQRWLDPSAALASLLTTTLLLLLAHQHGLQAEAQQQALLRHSADEANRAKSAFLANVSHELRTPLSSLLGLTELMRQGPLDEAQKRHVQLLGDSGQALLDLVDELLDLSRIEAGRLTLAPQPSALPALLQEVVEALRPRAVERGLRLELQLGEGLPGWVRVDGPRLRQVLRNLLGNAIKYTPQGLVSLQARQGEAGGVEFSVSDTGIGIASSQLQRIFEPFVQSQGRDEPRYGGTGLGLSISRQLVRQMGGDIEVRSVPGSGSRFTFCLPLAACPAAQSEPAPGPIASGLLVLLAERDELMAEVLSEQLQQLGVRVERAANGHLALALARRMRFDLLLLDLELPGLDAGRVLRGLREHEAQQQLPAVPVIALSTEPEPGSVDLTACFSAVLDKPISGTALRLALARWAPKVPRSDGATLRQEAGEAKAVAAPGSDPRRAHALVFLGRFGETWASARDTRAARTQLLSDLLHCAEAIGDPALADCVARNQPALASVPVAQQALERAERELLEAVGLALVGLHRPG